MSRRYPERPVLGVGALIFQDEAVLMIRRGQQPLEGFWALPGGGVEVGERLEAAIVREMMEETGLRVRPVSIGAVFERIIRDDVDSAEYHYVIVDYLCEICGGTLKAGSDVSDVRWIPLAEMDQIPLTDGTANVVRRVYSKRQALGLRSQVIDSKVQAV